MEKDEYDWLSIPESFYQQSVDPEWSSRRLEFQGLNDPVSLGAFRFVMGQASYNAWPALTLRVLTTTLIHEDAHHMLTQGTSLGHLMLHIKRVFDMVPKDPLRRKPADALHSLLTLLTASCVYPQESVATMTAYLSTWKVYGKETADMYLDSHGDSNDPKLSPYVSFVRPGIKLLSQSRLPVEEWAGCFNFMGSLAMNVDIDEYAANLHRMDKLRTFCSSHQHSANGRFQQLFGELPNLISQRGASSAQGEELKSRYYKESRTKSSHLGKAIVDSLISREKELNLEEFDIGLLHHIRNQLPGFPAVEGQEIMFLASHPPRKIHQEDYVFQANEADLAQFDVIEMGLAANPGNQRFGGVNINFFDTRKPPVKATYCMVHPAFAVRAADLLRDKTILMDLTVV